MTGRSFQVPCFSRVRGGVLVAALGFALALVGALPAHADEALKLDAEPIADGAFHVPGHHAPWGPDFHGQVSNSGFVIGSRCIAVIDSGGSPTVGRALLAAVRQRSTLPVCYVINTHVHPDHVMGNSAFTDANGSAAAPQFVGHRRLAAALSARAPFYLSALKRDFAAADQASSVPPPTLAVNSGLELDLGDRILELRAWPTAHTDNDLTVFDRRSGTLWLGDLVFAGHLPVLDGKLRGWLAVLKELKVLSPRQAVPGHGPVLRDWPAATLPTERYLQGLEADLRQALRDGLGLAQAVERLGGERPDLSATWLLIDFFHRRNLTAAYAELEWAE